MRVHASSCDKPGGSSLTKNQCSSALWHSNTPHRATGARWRIPRGGNPGAPSFCIGFGKSGGHPGGHSVFFPFKICLFSFQDRSFFAFKICRVQLFRARGINWSQPPSLWGFEKKGVSPTFPPPRKKLESASNLRGFRGEKGGESNYSASAEKVGLNLHFRGGFEAKVGASPTFPPPQKKLDSASLSKGVRGERGERESNV